MMTDEERAPMTAETAALARSITRASSKQSYLTARLLADNDLVDDCCRAYGYFRWVDDVVDGVTPVDASPSGDGASHLRDKRITFVRRQRELIDRLYRGERPGDLTPQEAIIADLVGHDRGVDSGLQSFIRNFLAIIEFDAHRRGRLVSQAELVWYSNRLGKAVTDAIQYFIGNGHPYPTADNHYLAATAAHITHMLRDMVEDAAQGYINIPGEYLEEHDINPLDVDSPAFRAWVRERVLQARRYFCEGKSYIDGLGVLRCKIAAYWYCARFEGLLDTIERDGYVLRAEYGKRRTLPTWLKMGVLAASVTLQHIARRSRRDSRIEHRPFELDSRDHPSTDRIP
jgi:phytoene/squalene synthetase